MIKKILSTVLFFGMFGVCCHLTGEEVFQNDAEMLNLEASTHSNLLGSRKCQQKKTKIFQADVSECRIGIENRSLLDSGAADFVTAFGGEDFTCSVIDVPKSVNSSGKALQILPANGDYFTVGNPPPPANGPVPGGVFDHVKFLAYSIFNYAPIDGRSSCSTWVGSGRQRHVGNEPYNAIIPGSVVNPYEDARLASFGFVSLDPAHLLTADWICTDDVIYALYERLPGLEFLFGHYAAFTYMIPVYTRDSRVKPVKDYHKFQTCYNRKEGTLTWKLDGKAVFQVGKLGFRLGNGNGVVFKKGKVKPLKNPDYYKVNDHGGDEVLVDPIGFQSGLSFFTLLDFYRPNNTKGIPNLGLVRLESNQFRGTSIPPQYFYNDPLAPGQQGSFVYNSTLDGSGLLYLPTIPSSARLWGQGAELRLASYEVSDE